MTRLEDYAAFRKNVQEFLGEQRASMRFFWDDSHNIVFRTEADRRVALEAETVAPSADAKVQRLTSTVTCLESLLEAPDWFDTETNPSNAWALERLRAFMAHALTTEDGWLSDKAAWVYCRVRTLGAALRLLDRGASWTDPQKETAAKLLDSAWRSRYDAGGAFGLREATDDPRGNVELELETSSRQYPPNAFLTYWGLLAADLSTELPPDKLKHVNSESIEAARGWLRENLAAQVAFHYAGSSHADPQQLIWSLCGLIRFGDQAAIANSVSVEHQLLEAALQAFFEQGTDGVWPTGAPLFHYKNAGNAYAYIYETLGELLSLATSRELQTGAAEAVRDALAGYSVELQEAFEQARRTGQRLDNGVTGWASGHHPHRNTPESWASGSVYRFGHALRRLVGMWSAAQARAALGARRAAGGGLEDLRNRGGTWNLGAGTAGGRLSTLFVQPARMQVLKDLTHSRFPHDPDQPILGDDHGRSAMLFGPPGTGKTRLIEAIAGALAWDFIEITPAQFLDRGVSYVSARADEIFRKVMELDRCVVLLDEIDELILQRTTEAETLSRFFTTTMLPRLAKLWDARRVLFFVNTNNIERVDSAIVRSQRFDAAIFVLPTGYNGKCALLAKHDLQLTVAEKEITNALLNHQLAVPDNLPIGWFALVRHDQMDALGESLVRAAAATGGSAVNEQRLKKGLEPLAQELSRLDWKPEGAKGEAPENGTKVSPTQPPQVEKLSAFQRRDSRMRHYASLLPDSAAVPEGLLVVSVASEGWVGMGSPDNPEQWAEEHGGVLLPDGSLRFHESTTTDS